jgi:ELWxxDGT repeat protein
LQLEALEDRTTPSVVGVKMIQDIAPGAGASNPAYFTEVNGVVYFAATDASGDRELWRTDGTTAGTYRVANINNTGSSNPKYLLNVNGILFFTADDGSGPALWAYDPQSNNANLVANIIPGPTNPVSINGVWYFSADDGSTGYELWSYDPSTSTLSQVDDINSGPGSSYPSDLTDVNGVLYFTADDGNSGVELWSYDPSTNTLTLVDINSGTGSSNPADLININGVLYFTADDGNSGVELWSYDPASTPLTLVADINSGPGSSYPSDLTDVNGVLYFTADNGSTGVELWSYDPATSALTLVADINPSGGAYPQLLTPVNGTLFFAADNGSNGVELWRTAIATTLNVVGGNNQNTTVNTAFANPLQVEVLDQFNEGMAGVTVSFAAPASGASATLSSSTATTGSNGQAQVTATANTIAGTYTVTASVNSLTASFTLTNNPAAPAALQIVSGNNQNTTVNTAFANPLVVQLVDQYGNAVSQSGVSVTFTAPSSGASATLSSSTVNTDANGQAQVTATANTIAGSYQVQVTSGSLTGVQFSLTNNPAAPAALQIVSGNNQNTTVNTTFGSPLVVEVRDQYGNPVPNVNVTFTAPSSGASALFGGNSTITVTTDANGQASVNADANTTAGSYNVTASVGSLSVNFALTNVAGPIAAVQFRIQPPTSVSVGQRFRVQVVLLDQYGNVVKRPNTGVRLSLRAGSGLSGTLVKRTSIHGLATFGDLSLSQPGRYRLVARLGNGLQVISQAITVV